jgi:3-oxosteroid 1-dehydrogenase
MSVGQSGIADHYDVIVVGSGVGGLATAVAAAEAGMSIAVLEKDVLLGGGTALSYGGIWAGCNHLAKAAGIPDSREAVLDYMRFVAGGCADEELMATFIDHAPVALEFFERCGVRMEVTRNLPDHYFPVAPGSTADGRSVEPRPISLQELGEWGPKIRDSFIDSRCISVGEFVSWGGIVNFNNWDHAIVADRKAKEIRTNGPALIAHLLKALLARGGAVFVESAVTGLVQKAGKVKGVRIGDREIRAERAVVLATGGWEGDPELRRQFEGVPEGCSPFPKAVSGDGLRLAVALGAGTALIRNNLAIMLGYYVPPKADAREPEFRLAQIMECQCPHTIIVNPQGARFSDESYFQDTVEALRKYNIWDRSYPNSPNYLIFDRQYVEGFSFAGAPPDTEPPEWVSRGPTLSALAGTLGISPEGLEQAVARFNGFAREGTDHDFHRGEKKWSLADRETIRGGNEQNRRLGGVEKAPFYGVRLYPGIFVSSGGVRTDRNGQVLNAHGAPIENLYAIGNVAAHLEYGIGYQAGYSLASGLTFGHLAAQHIESTGKGSRKKTPKQRRA